MSASNAGSAVGKQGTGKRTVVLTEKALANKIDSLQKDRKKDKDKIKVQISSLKELMKDDKNASNVKSQMNNLSALLENASSLHQSLMPLIPPEEQ